MSLVSKSEERFLLAVPSGTCWYGRSCFSVSCRLFLLFPRCTFRFDMFVTKHVS